MQKKLIALAVAGLMSAPVFAQSNVTVYGIVDVGYKNLGNNTASGVDSKNAVDSGQLSGSRLGFKGTEDLGNGLKASFVLETGINVDNGGFNQGNTAFGRQSYVALSGGFGTVAAGRQYTPQHLLMAAIDPFGAGTSGQIVNIWGLGSAATYPTRLNNLIAYVSPSFGGFNVIAGWTWAGNQQESLENEFTAGPITCTTATPPVCTQANVNDLRVWAINPNYVNGPIKVGFNYHNAKFESGGGGATAGVEVKVWELAGSYDLGVVKLAAAYGVDNPEGGNNNTKKAMVGATVPVGAAGKVLASYARAKHDAGDDKASQWAVGYTHDLSKRTVLYTAYAKQNNDNGGAITAVAGDATNVGQGYQRGFNLGVRHSF